MTSPRGRRAAVVGTGLIGGSIGLALRAQGWWVAGSDLDPTRAERALELGAVDEVGEPSDVDIVFVATPVGAVPDAAAKALANTSAPVTDVGSVKGPISTSFDEPRFIGGHPMAGSEQEGVDGARADLFDGAAWVLTPTATTSDDTLATVRSVVASTGAEVVTLAPEQHDVLVAMVSHVPHLTAATLMCLADERAVEHRALLRLAAGGFRDMTRIAAGHPGIWPDICAENRTAITETLDGLIEALGEVRAIVAGADRERLVEVLARARAARVSLPSSVERPEALVEVRVPIPDRPGELARITTLATEVDVNIFDLEIAHSGEGPRGVLILVVDAALGERFVGALMAYGYRPSSRPLG